MEVDDDDDDSNIMFLYIVASKLIRAAKLARAARPTRPTNPRLLANPSHQHKCLLIYCHCSYFLIFPLLTYCRPRYIFFAQDGRQKGDVPEPEVVQVVYRKFYQKHSCCSGINIIHMIMAKSVKMGEIQTQHIF